MNEISSIVGCCECKWECSTPVWMSTSFFFLRILCPEQMPIKRKFDFAKLNVNEIESSANAHTLRFERSSSGRARSNAIRFVCLKSPLEIAVRAQSAVNSKWAKKRWQKTRKKSVLNNICKSDSAWKRCCQNRLDLLVHTFENELSRKKEWLVFHDQESKSCESNLNVSRCTALCRDLVSQWHSTDGGKTNGNKKQKGKRLQPLCVSVCGCVGGWLWVDGFAQTRRNSSAPMQLGNMFRSTGPSDNIHAGNCRIFS